MAEPTVRVSGIVLSSLVFQHVNGDSDVEGLILGESKFEEQITISDSQADNIHIEEVYNIQKHISCLKLNEFYDAVGDVNIDAVKKILADNKEEDVIGCRSTPTGSTHKMEYAAFTSRSRLFVNIPVLVSNLGLLESPAYWKASAPCSAGGYRLATSRYSSNFFSSNGLLRDVNDVNAMSDAVQEELQRACRKLEESERLVESLQNDVLTLRRKIREKKSEGGPVVQRDQVLHQAFRSVFCSPVFHTHTLTLVALPVPDAISMTTAPEAPPPPRRKRLKETPGGRDRKSEPSE
uniref:Abraxas 1, BRCA1 A complex subunit n=1 Tax=Gasterosteus aculeatus aculeatus TaxID=481459 RepID=A0AAQ4PZM5_GASAC